MGSNLLRLHTVGISAGTSMSFETAPGTFNNANLDAADWAVYQAGLNGQYIMAPMTDIWNYYHGGMWNFVHWAYQQNSSGLTDVNGSVKGDSNNNQFFGTSTDQLRIRTLFKAYISAWLNHVNPYTGLAFKDDPTIAIIETGNELYSATAEWTQDIAAYIKSLAPNKLVADGSAAGGLVVSSAPGLNASSVDILGGHYYAQNGAPNWETIGYTSKPSRYGSNVSFLDQMASDAAAANSAGKAFIIGEYPWTRNDVASYYSAVESNSSIDGDMYWAYIANTDAGAPETHGGAFGSDDYSLHRPYANTYETTYGPSLATHITNVNGGTSTTTPAPTNSPNLIITTAIQHASSASYFTIGAGTIAVDSTGGQEGGSSLKITPANNDYPYWYGTTPSQWAPVTPGNQYTAVASVRKNTATSTGYHAALLWANSTGSVLSNTAGSYVAGANGSWVQVTATGTAPANAAYAVVQVQADTTHSSTDTFNVDEYGVFNGTNTVWSASDVTVAYTGSAALSGTGTISAVGTPKISVGVQLSAVGTLDVTAKITSTATFSGTGNLSATSNAASLAPTMVNLSGAGSLIPLGRAASRLISSGTLAVSGATGATRSVTFTGNGVLSAAGAFFIQRDLALTGSGSLTATGTSAVTQVSTGSAQLTGLGQLGTSVSVYIPPITPTALVPTPTLNFGGRATHRNLTGYSVQEDATPLDASSTEGGVGSINFVLPADEGSILLFDADIELDDDFRGTTSGTVTKVGISGGLNTVVADNRLGALVGNTNAKPISGTFEAVARYYLSLGMIANDVYFDPAISDIQVSAQGWSDDVWLKLKQLASAHRAEIALVSNIVTFRPVRSIDADVRRQTDFEVDLEKSDIAQAVEITYYDNFWVDGELVYPRTSNEQGAAQVYQVEAGQILEDDIELTASLESVLQPICIDDVAQDYDGTQSVYSVRAVDNSLVTAQNWVSGGGKIELTISDDSKSLHIKITGSSDQYRGPYRIAGRMKEVSLNNTTIVPPGATDNPAAAPAKADATAKATSTKVTTSEVTYPKSTNDYPWKTAPVNGLSPLRYSYRDCVDFVAWRINRDSGVKKAPWKWTWGNLRKTNGNAIGWKHDWELHGWKTGITPVPGAIAWFGSSAGALGHVAYVQAVDTVNKTVHLEEYNWGAKQAYHTRTIKWSSVDSFLASPAGSTKTIVENTTVKDAKDAAIATALQADADANKASADPAQSETDYASLRIIGTGVLIDPQVLTLPTGVPTNRTATTVGATVQNIYVSSLEDAYRAGVYVASRFTGETHTISGTITKMDQQGGGPGTLIYRKIEEFNRVYSGMTIADFNVQWAGKTIADFDRDQRTDTIGTFFDSQVFGNVAGARFGYGNSKWRINNTTITESAIEFSAVRDTMIEDFNEAHADKTIADFNAQYAGLTMKQFGRIPLLGG
jgi:hypothetical protein